ncbi:MAG: TraR/DksA C4-type zinc finger protein, partial [Lapillicoccus sp.]
AATKAAPTKAATKAAPTKTAAKTAAKTVSVSAKPATKSATKTATKTATTTASAPARTATKAAPTTTAPATKPAAAAGPSTATLRVARTEKPWTAKEVREIRAELESEQARAHADLEIAEADLQGLMRDAGEGAGDDQADAGASIFGREYEMSLAANSREKLDQIEHALERLHNGSYGVCESCGNPIGKLRLQAAPRATLCLACKTRQEHR